MANIPTPEEFCELENCKGKRYHTLSCSNYRACYERMVTAEHVTIPPKWYEFNPDKESLDECRKRRLFQCPVLSSTEREVLRQCRMTVWDGNVASKHARDLLVDKGLVVRWNGWQVVTQEGMAVLDTWGEMRDDQWPKRS